ncbi:unnamed protein product, partial [Mesorhabditis belari]|uniref:Uncharacterized protein n=1 Tax=Mesorhabditis belari TaxID=2138241 RepID=A0AAF3FLU5_9BILA
MIFNENDNFGQFACRHLTAFIRIGFCCVLFVLFLAGAGTIVILTKSIKMVNMTDGRIFSDESRAFARLGLVA